MYIPVRLPQNAFDLTRSTREMASPLARLKDRQDAFAPHADVPSFPPGLRDVGGELDRLLTRLAPTTQQLRRSMVPVRAEDSVERNPLERASVLTSTGELNPASTSYQKVMLDFGASTSVAKVSGVYTGTGAAAAASALTVAIRTETTMAGNVGNRLALDVLDQTGATVFSYDGAPKAGEAIYLGDDIGLSLTFSQGELTAAESQRMGVSRTMATKVDPYARFDDVDPNQRPRFEGGRSVVAGSFTLDGTTIEVKADDNIATVVQRMATLAPDLIATYEDDVISLTTRDATRRPIVLSDDSSGFLVATKLQNATTSTGFVAEPRERLAESARFGGGIRAGSFKLGDKSIAVDPSVDSIASLIERINDAGAGVTAYYDDEARVLVLRGGETQTEVGDDTSGLLAALGLPTGRSLAARESMTLPPGVAARLERAAAGREAELVKQTLAGLAFDPAAETVDANPLAASTAPGSARKAKVAYERETEEAREKQAARTSSASSFWSKDRPVAGLVGGPGADEGAGDRIAAG